MFSIFFDKPEHYDDDSCRLNEIKFITRYGNALTLKVLLISEKKSTSAAVLKISSTKKVAGVTTQAC